MEIEFVGQSNRDDDNIQADPSRLINCYRERHGEKFIIKSVLGTERLTTLPGVFMRAMREIGGEIYAVHGGALHRVNSKGDQINLGQVEDSELTDVEGNNGAITVSAGGEYYVYNAATGLLQPSTGAFEGASSVSILGQRTIITEPMGRRFGWSNPADPTTFNGLNFATAETEDDAIIRGAAINGQYWIFGERSVERWYLSGSGDPAQFLLPISGAVDEVGLKSYNLFTKVRNGAFYVGEDNIVRLVSGGQSTPRSTRAVETTIQKSTAAGCFYFEDEGHKFCALTFTDRPAWIYDISMNEWHERAEGSEFGPWSAVSSAIAFGDSFVGNNLGQVNRLTRNNKDVSDPLLRRAVSRNAEVLGEDFVVSRVQMRPRVGRSNLGREAQVQVRISKDRGETWGRIRTRSLGDQGQYRTRTLLKALGLFKSMTMEFTISDPAEIPFESTVFIK